MSSRSRPTRVGRQRTRKNPRKKRQATSNPNGRWLLGQQTSMVAHSTLLAPASTIARLRWNDVTLLRLAGAGVAFDSFNIRMNDAYDPDPVILTNQPTGFNEYCTFYNQYRVLSTNVHWVVSNKSTQQVSVFFYASRVLSTPSNVQAAIDLAGNSLATKVKMLLPVASSTNRVTFNRRYTASQVYGTMQEYMSNEAMAGIAGGSPGSPPSFMYIVFIAYSSSAWNATCYSSLSIDFEIEFYGRRQLVT
jgi:hypothetical protein